MLILLVGADSVTEQLLAAIITELGHRQTERVADYRALEEYLKNRLPELVILDVSLEESFEVVPLLEQLNNEDIPFAFILPRPTPEFVQYTKQYLPIGWLVKPVDRFQLFSTIELAAARRLQRMPREISTSPLLDLVFVKSNNIIYKIRFVDILYISAEGNYCTIVTQSRRIAVKMSLAQMQEIFTPTAFVQVHRNYLIRVDAIESISLSHNEILIQGFTIPISRQKFRDELLRNVKILK